MEFYLPETVSAPPQEASGLTPTSPCAFHDNNDVYSEMNSRYNNAESPCREMDGEFIASDEDAGLDFPATASEEVRHHLQDVAGLFPSNVWDVQRSLEQTLFAFPPPPALHAARCTVAAATGSPRPRSALSYKQPAVSNTAPPHALSAEVRTGSGLQLVLERLPTDATAVVVQPLPIATPPPPPPRESTLQSVSHSGSPLDWERSADVFFTLFLKDVQPCPQSKASPTAHTALCMTSENSVTPSQRFAVQWCGCTRAASNQMWRWHTGAEEKHHVAALIGFNYACGFALLLERVFCPACGRPVCLPAEQQSEALVKGYDLPIKDGEVWMSALSQDVSRNFLATALTFESLTSLLLYYYSF